MKRLQKESTQVKIIFVGMILVLTAVLLPLFIIAHYNFRCADDFGFCRTGEAVWEETHSVFRVMAEQAAFTEKMYHTWQGTYSSIWVGSCFMGIFSKNCYYMGTYLSLGGFVLAESFLLMVILVKILGSDVFRAGIVTMCCLCMQILMTPMPNEAFFWFTGAMFYTFMHSCALFLLAVLILLYQEKKIWKVVAKECVIVLLSIAVGGGNYITALTMLLLYFFIMTWTMVRKHPYRWIYLGDTLFTLIAFLINCLAPGNKVRQAASGLEPMSPAMAILRSLWEALKYINVNLTLPCIVLGILFLPLFLNIVRQKRFRYPWPVLVSLVSFGLFAAQFTPNLYALHIIGAGRVQNIYRLNFYLLLYGNELYWIGFMTRKWLQTDAFASFPKDGSKASFLLPGWILGGAFLCISLYLWINQTLTSFSAMQDLRKGIAEVYYQENQERVKLLTDDTQDVVYLEPFTYKPYVLFFADIEAEPNWINSILASYYGKEEVWLLNDAE